ncbi:MAG TPA: helix-turn-helix domain-containing protein [Streptosporangiaceae bacterium]|nr:helix-turn-helix domain-containing protein [Streptosporangiaceae bacterium]
MSGKPGPPAASRPFGERAERSFFCRSCKRVHRGLWVPEGWYVVERTAGGGARHLRLGLYCSLPCLEQAAAGHLAEVAANAETDLARDSARIVERAETMLHQGMTIRAAGDALGVPTSTLRHWLREAGVRVGPDGTLTGPMQESRESQEPPAPEPPAQEAGPTPAPGAKRPADPADQAALAELNHLVQLGYLAEVAWSFEAEGPAHARVFRAVATARLSGVPGELTGAAGANTKAAAKAAAARALLKAADRQGQ